MIEQGHNPTKCYNPNEVIAIHMKNPTNLAAQMKTLRQAEDIITAHMPDDGVFVAGYGEQHSTSAHIMAQAMDMATHPGTILFYEQPVDHLAVYAKEFYDLPAGDLSPKELQQADHKGNLYARMVIRRNAFPSPMARNHLMQAILDGNSTIKLIDAQRLGRGYLLNPEDPLVQKWGAEKFPEIDWTNNNNYCNAAEGSITRNFIMAERILSTLFHNETRIPLASRATLALGISHFGNKAHGASYEDSVPNALFTQAAEMGREDQIRLMSVFYEVRQDSNTPERILSRSRHKHHTPIIVLNADERSACEHLETETISDLQSSFDNTNISQAFRIEDTDDLRAEIARTLKLDL